MVWFSLYFIMLFLFFINVFFFNIIEALHNAIDHLYLKLRNAGTLSKYTFNVNRQEIMW